MEAFRLWLRPLENARLPASRTKLTKQMPRRHTFVDLTVWQT
jgi:hypothetical protein